MRSPDNEAGAPRLNELMLTVAKALRERLSYVIALGLDRKTLELLDLEDEEYIRRMPADDRYTHIRRTIRRSKGERESKAGLAQTELDRIAHHLMAERLRNVIPESFVAGEEATEAAWDEALAAPSGSYVWIIDAIDGSGPQDTVGFGYSVNALLYRKQGDGPAKPLLSVTVTSSAMMLGWIWPGTVGAAKLDVIDEYTGHPTIVEILEPLVEIDAIRRNWIATVGAQPESQERLAPLWGSGWALMTLGGAPAMPGLLIDRLAAVVIPTPQTRHDAAPLLALASGQGLHFVDIRTGRMYTDAQVQTFFDGIERPGSEVSPNPLYKPVPEMVVARDLLTALELSNVLRQHWETLERGEGVAGADNI